MPRATQDATRLQSSVVYGVFTLYDRLFQGVPLDSILPRRGPTTPVSPRRHGFGLFRVRSPLLTESLFIFSSYGYLDVSVPHVRLPYGMTGLQPAGLPHSDIPGSTAICASPPGFSQLITSFVASESQGIHRLPLLTFSHLVHTYGLIYLKLALLVSSF